MTSNKVKTILFASLIAAMILPFSSMDFADADNGKKVGITHIKDHKSDADVPLQKELKSQLKEAIKNAETAEEKAALKEQRKQIGNDIRAWYEENADLTTELLVREKQELLSDAFGLEQEEIGFAEMKKKIPWTTIGYDYVDKALEITIAPEDFKENKINKWEKKIRGIVGNEIDITISPQDYPTPQCHDYDTECNPIQGGVEFDTTASGPCSVGFAATYNGDDGFVTAGHCADGLAGGSGDDVEQPDGGVDVGDVEKELWYNNSRCDCAFISVTRAGWSVDDGVYDISTDPNTTANPFVGMTIKMSGQGSEDVTDGEVTDTSETVNYAGGITIKYLVVGDYDSTGGDSGAPIASGSSLVGIHSGAGGGDHYFTNHSKFTTYFSGLSWGF